MPKRQQRPPGWKPEHLRPGWGDDYDPDVDLFTPHNAFKPAPAGSPLGSQRGASGSATTSLSARDEGPSAEALALIQSLLTSSTTLTSAPGRDASAPTIDANSIYAQRAATMRPQTSTSAPVPALARPVATLTPAVPPRSAAPAGQPATRLNPRIAVETLSRDFWQERDGTDADADRSEQACTARLANFWENRTKRAR